MRYKVTQKGVWLDAAVLRKVFPSLQWSLYFRDGSLTHGGEADSDGRGLANVLKDFGFAVASDVVRHLEVAKGTWRGGGGQKSCFFALYSSKYSLMLLTDQTGIMLPKHFLLTMPHFCPQT